MPQHRSAVTDAHHDGTALAAANGALPGRARLIGAFMGRIAARRQRHPFSYIES
jgi:hypothetical protein